MMEIPNLSVLLFDAGLVLLAIALFWFSLILRELIAVLGKPKVWILTTIGALILLISAGIHFYTHATIGEFIYVDTSVYRDLFQFKTLVFTSTPHKIFLRNRMFVITGILSSSLLSLIAGLFYYKWSGE